MIELNNASISNSWVLDTGCGTHICFNVQGLTRNRRLRPGELDLIMGNKDVAPVEMIGDYKLYFDSGLYIVLGNVCYSANMARNIMSFNALYLDGFDFKFDNGSILVYKDNMFYFKASPYKGILETTVSLCDSSILNIDSSKNGLDKTYL